MKIANTPLLRSFSQIASRPLAPSKVASLQSSRYSTSPIRKSPSSIQTGPPVLPKESPLMSIQNLPHNVGTVAVQKERVLQRLREKTDDLDKYEYLVNLRNANRDLFYRVVMDNVREMMPLIYTPTIGTACIKYSHLFSFVSHALFLSYEQKGKIAQILSEVNADVSICVVTDGSRILGLGDLGVDGVGIPMGKLSLYTACAGINPKRTLPVVIDVGTNNAEKLKDPLYMGLRQNRITPLEEKAFVQEFMEASQKRWPGIVVQFEDFSTELAFDLLADNRDRYPAFNDDIQGTAAVSLAGFINAVNVSGIPVEQHKIVFFGAGSAAVGIAKLISEYFEQQGIPEETAKNMITLVDSKGLVADNRGDRLPAHKVYFSKAGEDTPRLQVLEEVIEHYKPTALLGLSTVHASFNEQIIKRMAELNKRPIIFALSNPLTKAECTFDQAVQWTDGRVLFASGSPFPNVVFKGEELVNSQGNNVYIFPGLGLGAILSKTATIPEELIHESANALADSTTTEEKSQGMLYPHLERIREVSGHIAFKVIRKAQALGIDQAKDLRDLSDEKLKQHIHQNMYDPLSSTASSSALAGSSHL